MRTHDRYDYDPLPERRDFSWPEGRRLAVYLGLNLEHFAFGEGLGAELAPGGPQPDVLNYAWRDYGNRIGAWRLLRMFDELRLPCSVLVNSAMYGYAPELVAAFRARGDEIVGHGRTNSERQGVLSEADERALIREATEVSDAARGTAAAGLARALDLARATSRPTCWPRRATATCWTGAMTSSRSGCERAGGGRILSVPYPQELNDIPQIVGRKREGDEFADMIVDSFDEMLAECVDRPLVMGVALHPYLVGHPHRAKHLRRALRHIVASGRRASLAKHFGEYCCALLRIGGTKFPLEPRFFETAHQERCIPHKIM